MILENLINVHVIFLDHLIQFLMSRILEIFCQMNTKNDLEYFFIEKGQTLKIKIFETLG